MPKGKERIDKLLVERGLILSRQKAQALIMAGSVLVDGQRVDKAGTLIKLDSLITLKETPAFVGRGGLKLEGALGSGDEGFSLDVTGLSAMDVGSSTGGFTDCLLKSGASKVIAIDVGKGLMDQRLVADKRVTLLEGVNIRYLGADQLPFVPDMAVIDVSFISLKKVLPKVGELIKAGGRVLALIKPQFEVGRGEVGKGGIVKDPEKHKAVIDALTSFAEEAGFIVEGVRESAIKGAKGNREFWILLTQGL